MDLRAVGEDVLKTGMKGGAVFAGGAIGNAAGNAVSQAAKQQGLADLGVKLGTKTILIAAGLAAADAVGLDAGAKEGAHLALAGVAATAVADVLQAAVGMRLLGDLGPLVAGYAPWDGVARGPMAYFPQSAGYVPWDGISRGPVTYVPQQAATPGAVGPGAPVPFPYPPQAPQYPGWVSPPALPAPQRLQALGVPLRPQDLMQAPTPLAAPQRVQQTTQGLGPIAMNFPRIMVS